EGLLTLTGVLMIGRPDSEAMVAARAAAAQHGLDVRTLDTAEVRRRYRGHIVADDEIGLFDPQGGFLRPEAVVWALLSGMEVRRSTEVTGVEPGGKGVTVRTAGGAESFDAAVIATGPWMRELVPFLPLQVERQVLV